MLRLCTDARVYGHTTTAVHEMSTPPSPLSSLSTQSNAVHRYGAGYKKAHLSSGLARNTPMSRRHGVAEQLATPRRDAEALSISPEQHKKRRTFKFANEEKMGPLEQYCENRSRENLPTAVNQQRVN